MTPKTSEDYGASIDTVNAEPVEDSMTELDAAYYKRLAEDVAQMTRTAPRAIIVWTTGDGGDQEVAVRVRTMWGDTAEFFPVVDRADVGEYTLTFPSEFQDGYGEDETLSFFAGHSEVSTLGEQAYCETSVSGAVVSVNIYLETTDAVDDLTAGVTEVTTWIY